MGKFILRIFDGIAKVLAFVLISLGLWLPAAFTVGFFITCGVTNTAFAGLTEGLFWGGLAVTAVLGFGLAMYVRSRKRNKGVSSAPSAPAVERKRKKKDNAEEYAQQNIAYSHGYMPPQQPYPPQNAYPPQSYGAPYPPQGQPYAPPYSQPYYPPPQSYAPPPPPPERPRSDVSDLEKKYFAEKPPERYERTASFDEGSFFQEYGRTMSKTEQREADSRLDSEELWRRLSGTDVPDEQPLVFRTRKDPDLYVYEYSDRYQYWRRTKTGMVFENTEYKKKQTENAR